MQVEPFGTAPDGAAVSRFTLGEHGLRVSLINWGAAIASIVVPDAHGRETDVVLGFDDLASYVAHRGCLGVVVGRVANRIDGAAFTLDGRRYPLATRPDGLHIHGGPRGFDRRTWTAVPDPASESVRFERVSPDGEEGYPGTCRVSVRYTVTGRALTVAYHATTDAPTVINLSQHVYFNLAGHDAGTIGGHRLQLWASRFTPMNDRMMPTGEIRAVAGTPFDFRTPEAIGARIDDADPQLILARGYDHNYVIDRDGPGLAACAAVEDPVSGRTLTVATTEPGVQFYTGNSLHGQRGKGGAVYRARSGFCLETQHFPNSPNIPAFPSIVLRPGGQYESSTVFTFGAR